MKTQKLFARALALLLIAASLCATTASALNSGFIPETLTLQPGGDTTALCLNWYGGAGEGGLSMARFVSEDSRLDADGTAGAASSGKIVHRVTVTGLIPGADYTYQVSNDGKAWSEPYAYSAPEAGDFTFAWISDPQLVNYIQDPGSAAGKGKSIAQGWNDTLYKIAASDAGLIVSSGDQVDTTFSWLESEYAMLLDPPLMRALPFAPAVGNHDRNAGFIYHFNLPNEQDVSAWLSGAAAATNVTSARGNYYFKYNEALFVVLNDSPYPADAAAAKPFIAAFDKTLSAAVSAYPDAQWLFVVHHKSTESIGVHAAAGDTDGYVAAGFEKLMDQYGVDFVLAGHDHYYERSYALRDGKIASRETSELNDPYGTVYLTSNTSSGVKYYGSYGSSDRLAVVKQEMTPCYTLVNVSQNRVTFTAYDTYGDDKTPLDTFSVTKAGVPADTFFFRDVAGHWARNGILDAVSDGLMDGTGPVTFSPDQPLTRAMAVVTLFRMDGGKTDPDSLPWYTEARAWAMAAGISDGMRMDDPVTREQLAAMLYRYAAREGADISPGGNLAAFPDAGQISNYAVTAVSWAAATGVMEGDGAGLSPRGGATRAQTAVMLERLSGMCAGN